MEQQKFKYRSLDTFRNEIRLLRILPGSEDPISCTLSHISLDSLQPYDALSYAWQERTIFSAEQLATREIIIIDGVEMEVEVNLAAFLKAARSIRWEQPFWIDAVCINQIDVPERNDQILRMRDIYRKATKGVVWLGPENANSDLAIEFAQFFFSQRPGTGTEEEEWLLSNIKSGDYSQHWQAFIMLLTRSWWERIWTIQEIVLSQDPLVLCGSCTIDWSSLSKIIMSTSTHLSPIAQELENRGLESHHIMFGMSKASTRVHLTQSTSLDLLQTIAITRRYDSTNAKDKIYGVLGLANDAERMVPHPDYSQTVLQNYVNLVVSTIKERGDLDVLAFASPSESPSFVPYLGQGTQNGVNPAMLHESYQLVKFRASGNYVPVFQLSQSFDALTLRGIQVDVIDGLGAHPFELSGHGIAQHGKSNSNVYMDDETSFEAIWRSLLGGPGLKTPNRPFHSNDETALRGLLAEKLCSAEEALQTRSDQKSDAVFPPPTFTSDVNAGDPRDPRFNTWYEKNRFFRFGDKTLSEWAKIHRHSSDQSYYDNTHAGEKEVVRATFASLHMAYRLITTQSGRVGMATRECERGDLICVLFGGRMPLVLRPQNGHYILISESYIHGLMNGEAIDELEKGKSQVQDFELR